MITDAKIAAAFGVDEADVTDAMRDLVDRALTWVERETDRFFRQFDEFVEHFAGGRGTLWLAEVPVEGESGDAVTVKKWDTGTEDWVEIEATEYEVRPSRTADGLSRVVHNTCFPQPPCVSCARRENIRVTYFAGYAVGGLPGDIEQLVLDLAVARFRATENETEGLKKEMIDGYSYERFGNGDGGVTGLTDEHRSTIYRWRHEVFA